MTHSITNHDSPKINFLYKSRFCIMHFFVCLCSRLLQISLSNNNYVALLLSVFFFFVWLFLSLSLPHCTRAQARTQHCTPYFMSPRVSALSLDYNVVSHYTLWARWQCSRGLNRSKSSDFCHVGTAQLDN